MLQSGAGDYSTMIKEARDCFETGRHEQCDSILAELRGMKLKRLQRRKVCTLWLDNTYRTGNYEDFLDALHSKYVKRNLDHTDYVHWNAISTVPPMEVTRTDNSVLLPLRTIGPQENSLYGTNVSVNGMPLVGVIDNCATDYCSISTELAEQLGVRPIGMKVRYNSNRRAKAYIGVIDSLSFGSLVIRNALVSVSDNLAAIQATHPFDIIIGGNVLYLVGDIIIDNENETITFSEETLNLAQNVFWAYETHDYYVEGCLDDHDITMLFDLGNTSTNLGPKYYERFPIDSTYVEGTGTRQKVDRSWTSKVYIIEKARFELCGTVLELPDVPIYLQDYGAGRRYDGKIGVNALRQFRTVVFNTRKLYLQLND